MSEPMKLRSLDPSAMPLSRKSFADQLLTTTSSQETQVSSQETSSQPTSTQETQIGLPETPPQPALPLGQPNKQTETARPYSTSVPTVIQISTCASSSTLSLPSVSAKVPPPSPSAATSTPILVTSLLGTPHPKPVFYPNTAVGDPAFAPSSTSSAVATSDSSDTTIPLPVNVTSRAVNDDSAGSVSISETLATQSPLGPGRDRSETDIPFGPTAKQEDSASRLGFPLVEGLSDEPVSTRPPCMELADPVIEEPVTPPATECADTSGDISIVSLENYLAGEVQDHETATISSVRQFSNLRERL